MRSGIVPNCFDRSGVYVRELRIVKMMTPEAVCPYNQRLKAKVVSEARVLAATPSGPESSNISLLIGEHQPCADGCAMLINRLCQKLKCLTVFLRVAINQERIKHLQRGAFVYRFKSEARLAQTVQRQIIYGLIRFK